MIREMPNKDRHGWFRVPGIQPKGDRDIADQMMGLEDALAEARDKTVLDVGCAEGPISLAFAQAGAAHVTGLEYVKEHLVVANELVRLAGITNIGFKQCNLKEWAERYPQPKQYDIVLALGVIHKLWHPEVGAEFVAKSSKDLILFRAPGGVWNGIVPSKARPKNTCDFFAIMKAHNFAHEKTIRGKFDEGVWYFRKQR